MATILIVDDLAANRDVLVGLLRPKGHRMVEAADGREGLAAVHTEHPDLVITDVLMPVMDGYELVRQLRLDPEISATPVVFCTAHYGEREARTLALSNGVSHVLNKPIESAQLMRVVDDMLAHEEVELADAPPLALDFGDEHLRLLTDKLYEKDGDLKAANVRLRAMINIGLELASERDTDRLLEGVCVAARDLFGATYITLGIVNLSDRTVEKVFTCGTDASSWIKAGDSISGILGTVIAKRRTMRGENPGGDPLGPQFPPRHPKVQAFLVAPVASPAKVYGWFSLVANEGRPFPEEDEDLVTALAGQIGRIYETGYFHAVALQKTKDLEREIDIRKTAESTLRIERDRTQRYLDTAETMLLALDVEGRITLANRYACSILGWSAEELIGRDWVDTCIPLQTRSALRKKLHDVVGGDATAFENQVLTKAGKELTIEWRNTPLRDDARGVVGSLSSGTDVTARRMLEEQYRHAQKMEAVGRLAGGIAHDFNNLLTAILGYCELLLSTVGLGDRPRDDIVEIQHAGKRAAGLTRQLLAFSRKEIIEPTLLDLNALVTDVRAMLGRLIGEDVTVTMVLRPDVGPVIADRGQIEQIVVNLALNARDAMPNGGALTIETANVELDDEYAKSHLSVQAGRYVGLTVSDTGLGMRPEVQARLFEPFFTTKPPGKGTGLGLATVHGIVAQSGGSVNVYSEVGLGTSFHVYFPRADAETGFVAGPPLLVDGPHTGTETILVVEDAEGLRQLAIRLLERQGYTVLVAANATEARRLFDENASIDVLLTDVVMPGASGPDLTRQLVEQRPALKVIYMSGYTEDAIVHHGVIKPGIAFLHKPFTSETLGRKIREVIDR